MNDDYLWDRSGEPDPEVERLEQVLGKYRYQPKPVSPALQSRLSQHHGGWMRLAAVAAAILIVLTGFWIYKVQNNNVTNPAEMTETRPPENPAAEKQAPAINQKNEVAQIVPRASAPRHKIYRKAAVKSTVESLPATNPDYLAGWQPIINPFVDVETARHIERAQLLLRAFRNSRDTSSQPEPDLSYERQRSLGLLSTNILLRRDAEAKGNLPVEELLGSLEPFLLDIANLPDRPSNEDVRSIKERMHKKEIVSALQVYSAPTLSQVF
jgi:hypothetical protein